MCTVYVHMLVHKCREWGEGEERRSGGLGALHMSAEHVHTHLTSSSCCSGLADSRYIRTCITVWFISYLFSKNFLFRSLKVLKAAMDVLFCIFLVWSISILNRRLSILFFQLNHP